MTTKDKNDDTNKGEFSSSKRRKYQQILFDMSDFGLAIMFGLDICSCTGRFVRVKTRNLGG